MSQAALTWPFTPDASAGAPRLFPVEEEKRRGRPAAIAPNLAVAIVHKVTQAYRPASLMTFGGEPLLYT